MKLGNLHVTNDNILDSSDIKLLYNVDIILRITTYEKNIVNDTWTIHTEDAKGKIGGFKLGSFFSQDEMFLLILFRNNINLNFHDKSIIDKGIFSLFHTNPFSNVCKVKRFYRLTNNFQGYDYYVWLPYNYYLECIKAIRRNYNSNLSNLPLLICI